MTKKIFPSESRIIPISLIDENPQNPRSQIGDTSDLEASIKAHGLLNPITVRPVGKRYQVVAGSRRFAALKNLAYKSVKCEVRTMTDKNAFEISTTENVTRREMNAADECNAVSRLIDDGSDIHTIAARFGRTPRWVIARKKMHDLGDDVMKLLEDGEITLGHAEALTMADEKNLKDFIYKAQSGYTPDQLKRAILNEKKNLSEAKFDYKKICKNCEKQTIKQQDIFGDVSESYCLDGECFQKNIDKKIKQIREDFENQGFKECPEEDSYGFDYYTFDWVDIEDEEKVTADKKLAVEWLRKNNYKPYFKIYNDATYKFKFHISEYRDAMREKEKEDDDEKIDPRENNILHKMSTLASDEEIEKVKDKITKLLENVDDEIIALLLDLDGKQFETTAKDEDGNEETIYESFLDHLNENVDDETQREYCTNILIQHYSGLYERNNAHKFFDLGTEEDFNKRKESKRAEAERIVDEEMKREAEENANAESDSGDEIADE